MNERALETMGWDGFLDLAKCEWRLCVWHSSEGILLLFMLTGGSHSAAGSHCATRLLYDPERRSMYISC